MSCLGFLQCTTASELSTKLFVFLLLRGDVVTEHEVRGDNQKVEVLQISAEPSVPQRFLFL